MIKVIVLDYVTGNILILKIPKQLLAIHNNNFEEVLINYYDNYHPEISWMVLNTDNFGNFNVEEISLSER